MKYISLSVAAALMLSGCQLPISKIQSEAPKTNQEEQSFIDIASVNEINQALLVDEAIDVIHTVADVNVDLGNKQHENYLANDLWQRIRGQLNFSIPENRRIKSQRDWFVKHPAYLDRVAKRAEPFL